MHELKLKNKQYNSLCEILFDRVEKLSIHDIVMRNRFLYEKMRFIIVDDDEDMIYNAIEVIHNTISKEYRIQLICNGVPIGHCRVFFVPKEDDDIETVFSNFVHKSVIKIENERRMVLNTIKEMLQSYIATTYFILNYRKIMGLGNIVDDLEREDYSKRQYRRKYRKKISEEEDDLLHELSIQVPIMKYLRVYKKRIGTEHSYEYEVRGHYRNTPNGGRVWIEPHIRCVGRGPRKTQQYNIEMLIPK